MSQSPELGAGTQAIKRVPISRGAGEHPSVRYHIGTSFSSPVNLTGREVLENIGRIAGGHEKRKLFELLLWYGIFGLLRDDERVTYIYDARYDMRRLLGLIASRGGNEARLRLNPAFWKALEAKS